MPIPTQYIALRDYTECMLVKLYVTYSVPCKNIHTPSFFSHFVMLLPEVESNELHLLALL